MTNEQTEAGDVLQRELDPFRLLSLGGRPTRTNGRRSAFFTRKCNAFEATSESSLSLNANKVEDDEDEGDSFLKEQRQLDYQAGYVRSEI